MWHRTMIIWRSRWQKHVNVAIITLRHSLLKRKWERKDSERTSITENNENKVAYSDYGSAWSTWRTAVEEWKGRPFCQAFFSLSLSLFGINALLRERKKKNESMCQVSVSLWLFWPLPSTEKERQIESEAFGGSNERKYQDASCPRTHFSIQAPVLLTQKDPQILLWYFLNEFFLISNLYSLIYHYSLWYCNLYIVLFPLKIMYLPIFNLLSLTNKHT